MIKKTLSISLLALTVASIAPVVQAAPTIYGNLLLTLDYVDQEAEHEDDSDIQVNSNSSRVGFKGSDPITQETDVIYQLEYGIDVDGDDDQTFRSRDTYLGVLNKSFGEFRMGRNYSVVDYINNVSHNVGYWDNIGISTLDSNDPVIPQALSLTDGVRINSSMVWIAPQVDKLPLQLALMYSAEEAFGDDDEREHGYGASLFYDKGEGFTAGLAYDKDMSIHGDLTRGTVSADLTDHISYPVTVSALYQLSDYDDAEEEKGLIVAADMALHSFARPASIFVQYDKTKNLGGVDNFDSDQIVLGGRYEFKDNVIAHAYAGKNSADKGSEIDIDVLAIGGGLQYLF